MVENTQNSFEMYISFFIFYIIFINYINFMGQILIFRFKTQSSLINKIINKYDGMDSKYWDKIIILGLSTRYQSNGSV